MGRGPAGRAFKMEARGPGPWGPAGFRGPSVAPLANLPEWQNYPFSEKSLNLTTPRLFFQNSVKKFISFAKKAKIVEYCAGFRGAGNWVCGPSGSGPRAPDRAWPPNSGQLPSLVEPIPRHFPDFIHRRKTIFQKQFYVFLLLLLYIFLPFSPFS